MLDVILIAVGCGSFAAAIAYAYACDGCEESAMLIDYILGGAVTLGLLVYLVYALLRPERF